MARRSKEKFNLPSSCLLIVCCSTWWHTPEFSHPALGRGGSTPSWCCELASYFPAHSGAVAVSERLSINTSMNTAWETECSTILVQRSLFMLCYWKWNNAFRIWCNQGYCKFKSTAALHYSPLLSSWHTSSSEIVHGQAAVLLCGICWAVSPRWWYGRGTHSYQYPQCGGSGVWCQHQLQTGSSLRLSF